MFSLVTISYFFQKSPLWSPSIQIHAFAQLDILQPLFSYVTSSFRNTEYKFQKCLSPCDKELLPWCDNTVLNLFTDVGDGLLTLCPEHGHKRTPETCRKPCEGIAMTLQTHEKHDFVSPSYVAVVKLEFNNKFPHRGAHVLPFQCLRKQESKF